MPEHGSQGCALAGEVERLGACIAQPPLWNRHVDCHWSHVDETFVGANPRAVESNPLILSSYLKLLFVTRPHAPLVYRIPLRRLAGTCLPCRPPRSLRQNSVFAFGEDCRLFLVDSLEPVTEACSGAREDGVCPQRSSVEQRSHLEAQLPQSGGDACTSEIS